MDLSDDATGLIGSYETLMDKVPGQGISFCCVLDLFKCYNNSSKIPKRMTTEPVSGRCGIKSSIARVSSTWETP